MALNIGGAKSTRFTLLQFCHGRKQITLLIILREKHGGKIEKSFSEIVSAKVTSCVEVKVEMYSYAIYIWYNKVHLQYVSNIDGISGLQMDCF